MSQFGLDKGYIALRLDPDTREKLDLLSAATGWRRADIVSEAVRRFVNQGLAELQEMQQQGRAPTPKGKGKSGGGGSDDSGGHKVIV